MASREYRLAGIEQPGRAADTNFARPRPSPPQGFGSGPAVLVPLHSSTPATALPLDLSTFVAPPNWSRLDRALFEQLRALAEAQLGQPGFSPAQLADAAHLSERTLYRRLQELTGYTPAGFVRELRLLRARQLLRAGELGTVGEVAFAVGFVNANHFGRVYTRRFGYPPGQDFQK